MIVNATYADPENASVKVEYDSGRISFVPVSRGNADYDEIVRTETVINPYTDPPDRRTYRKKRLELYAERIPKGGEKDPLTALGDTVDSIVAYLVSQDPQLLNDKDAGPRKEFGDLVKAVLAIKGEIPKPQ